MKSTKLSYGEEFTNFLDRMIEASSSIAFKLEELRKEIKGKRTKNLDDLVRDLTFESVSSFYSIKKEEIIITGGEEPLYVKVWIPRKEVSKENEYKTILEGEFMCAYSENPLFKDPAERWLRRYYVSLEMGKELPAGTQKLNLLENILKYDKFFNDYKLLFRPDILLTKRGMGSDSFKNFKNIGEFLQRYLERNNDWGYEFDLERIKGLGGESIVKARIFVKVPSVKAPSKVYISSTPQLRYPHKVPEEEKTILKEIVNGVSETFLNA